MNLSANNCAHKRNALCKAGQFKIRNPEGGMFVQDVNGEKWETETMVDAFHMDEAAVI